VADARRLVDVLARSPEVLQDGANDPRVGVAGASYGGALSLMLAGTDRRVDAVAADITWNDLARALFPNGSGGQPGVFKKLWSGYLFQSGFGQPGPSPSCGRFAPDICAAYQRAAQTGSPDAAMLQLLRQSSPATVLSGITAPVLLTQGEEDSLFPLSEADANARGIAAHGTPVRVVWRRGGHDDPTDGGGATTLAREWFDSVLKRHDPPATPFQIAQRGAALSAASGRAVSQTLVVDGGYPSAARSVPIPLQGPAQTINAPAGGNPAAVTSVPGLGGLLGAAGAAGAANPVAPLSAIPGQVAAFDSAPLDRRLLVAGAARITLTITTRSTSDVTVFAALRDASSGGSAAPPDGLVAPVRLSGLKPGVPATVTATLPGIVREIAAGHRLRVTVSTTDFAYAMPIAPRQYTVQLGDPTLAVSTVSATVLRAGHPVAWLIVGGLTAAVLAAAGTLAAVWTRRRSARPDPTLAGVPIAVSGLVKEYRDGYRAVDDVTFRVERGQIVGLLGPNGAGKTTTLRMLVGLILPTAGQIHVFGEPVVPGAPVLSRIGAFIEGPGFLPHLTGRDNLRLYWAATGRPDAAADFDTALQIAGLGPSIDRRVKTYSHGMRQRLAIAQAMLGLPELLVLDEPTNGLDPPQIAEMRDVLRGYARTGRTVVLSSHLLAEVEQTSTHVVVMHKGKLIAAGSVAEVAGAGTMQLAVHDPARASDVLAAAGIASSAVPARRALEDVFLALVGDE
jgi:ABC-2 type transport system ATP-binding protein